MVDAYHEFDHPREMMEGIVKSLKPGGRVALVEYRAEDPKIAIKPLHKMTVLQASKEMAVNGFSLVYAGDFLPMQHFLLYQKVRQK